MLGDIPILGKLFRSESNDQSKNNLYVFLRAHILSDEDFRDGLDLTEQADKSMRQFDADLKPSRFKTPEVERRRAVNREDDVILRQFDLNPGRPRGKGLSRQGEPTGATTPPDYNVGDVIGPGNQVEQEVPELAPAPAEDTAIDDEPLPLEAAPRRKLRGWFE